MYIVTVREKSFIGNNMRSEIATLHCVANGE